MHRRFSRRSNGRRKYRLNGFFETITTSKPPTLSTAPADQASHKDPPRHDHPLQYPALYRGTESQISPFPRTIVFVLSKDHPRVEPASPVTHQNQNPSTLILILILTRTIRLFSISDLDAYFRPDQCNTLIEPNLGYSVSGQGGSTRCFRGSERFVP